MERRFLDFLELAERSRKPRTRGLTTVLEQAQSISVLRDTLNV
jgi:phosphosulfolactate synthase (CoM biosynthesis protein A)